MFLHKRAPGTPSLALLSDSREKTGLGPARSPHPQSIKKTEKPKTLPFRRNYGRPYRVSNSASNFSMCHSLENSKLSTKQLATSKNVKKTCSFGKFRLPEKEKMAAPLHGGSPPWGSPPWGVPPIGDPLHWGVGRNCV